MRLVCRWCFMMVLFSLAGCESTPNHLLTYAAQGTVIQAQRLVGQLLGKEVWPLPYDGMYASTNISLPLNRMQARFPALKALLESGEIGLTDDGDVAMRDTASVSQEVVELVDEENRDRAVFYLGMCSAVGHGDGDVQQSWLRYVRVTFGAEWKKQAPNGWWLRNERGEWFQKTI